MKGTASKYGNLLIVDDNEDLLKAAHIFLKRQFQEVRIETNPERIPDLLSKHDFDIILLDMNFTKDVSSGQEGFYWLNEIAKIDPELVVVMMTAYGDVEMAVKAIQYGAVNFILKPWTNEKLLATLHASLQLKNTRVEVQRLKISREELYQEVNKKYDEIIGESQQMVEVFSLIDRVAKTDTNVLILGENGTGKELVARAIHNNSLRNKEAFVSVDLGAISESLFESELFGHKKGAFTDAKEDRPGRFEVASNGSLFLDEIGNLSLPLQVKLLSALQNRKITRLGSNTEINVDIRLVCATNMDLYEMVDSNEFRQDLLYRINTIEIKLPPLRERKSDIKLLAQHFLKKYVKKYQMDVVSISKEAIEKLESHSWPGNIRELQHAIERAVIMCNGDMIKAKDFTLKKPAKAEETSLENMKIDDVEKILIERTLAKHDQNITKAANELGLTRTSLYRRIKKYDL